MKVLFCLPTKNEKESIQTMIDRIKELGFDLIVCDEDSSDGTIEIARKNSVPVYQRDGKGKGYGIAKALEIGCRLGYEYLVLIDCDCSYPPEEVLRMVEFLPEYDMVMGSRDMKSIQFLHRLVNILHTGAINLLFYSWLKDINSGFRIVRLNKFHGLINARGFDVEAQITACALKNKLKIKEVPIGYRKRKGKSKIRAFDTFLILKRIIKERFRK